MSAVYMCDNCGELFSVNARGWRQFTENGDSPEFHNVYNHGAMTKHIGPCCNQTVTVHKPRLAIDATVVETEDGS
jgi:hypothetical protein